MSLSAWERQDIRELLREELRLEVHNRSELHNHDGEDHFYLCLVLGDKVIDNLGWEDLRKVLNSQDRRYP